VISKIIDFSFQHKDQMLECRLNKTHQFDYETKGNVIKEFSSETICILFRPIFVGTVAAKSWRYYILSVSTNAYV